MLTIRVESQEVFDATTRRFKKTPELVLELEHSLVSISKWESRYEKAFLGKKPKTKEETLAYILDMVVTPKDVDYSVLAYLSKDHYDQIQDYIQRSASATHFAEFGSNNTRPSETVTSELIYYWMIQNNVPQEYERWHLNRLFTLLRICASRNAPKKRVSSSEIMARNSRINAERREQYGTSG